MLYDSMQTAHGNLVLKCYKLTDADITWKKNGKNEYMDPKLIFQEIPVTFTNPGLVKELLMGINGGGSSTLNNNNNNKNYTAPVSAVPQLEKMWASSDAPRHIESLLMANQIRMYCDQVDRFASGSYSKLFLAGDCTRSNILIYIHCLFIYNEKECYS